MQRCILLILCSLFYFSSFSTSIVPFNDLSHLSSSAQSIFLVKSLPQKEIINGDITSYYNEFQVLDVLKGDITEKIVVKSGSMRVGPYLNMVHGEFDFHNGDTYLLFLDKMSDGSYSPVCLSYYVFQEIKKHKESFLVPRYQSGELNILGADNNSIHRVFKTNEFTSSIKSFINNRKDINYDSFLANDEDQQLTDKLLKASPVHCSYLQTNTGTRYRVENLGSEALPVYYQNSGSECSNIGAEINSAIDHMNENYTGIEIESKGPVSGYRANCSGGRAYDISFFGGTYDTYIDNNIGNPRTVLIQFSDPCNEIAPLNGCSGTVAFGGTWALGSHVANGETFNTALYGYVVINEGVGNCNCGNFNPSAPISNYSGIIAHELGHTIGLNHINSSYGSANMNPISGSEITSLDVQCIDDLYPSNFSGGGNVDEEVDNGAIDVEPNPFIDFQITSCGNYSFTNNTISISNLSIQNTGNINSGNAAKIGFYLSTDNSIQTNDRLLGSSNIPNLTPNATTQLNRSFNISNIDLADGNYNVGIIIDYTNAVSESNEANNTCVHTSPKIIIDTAPVGQPDIVLASCGTANLNATNLRISNVVVRNSGTASTVSNSFIGYYLSLDGQISDNDYYLGNDRVGVLNVNNQNVESATFNISNLNVADGSYFVLVVADYTNRVTESNENNNSCYIASPKLTIAAPVQGDPDIEVSCGSSTFQNGILTLGGVSVTNTGSVTTAGYSYIAYYLSSDNNITTDDFYLGYDYVGTLRPDQSSNESARFNLSVLSIPDGEYFVGIISDFTNNIVEASESNNVCHIANPKINIGNEPVPATVADLNIECGTTNFNQDILTISNTKVTNVGELSAGGHSFIGYYLSTDQHITTGDYYLGFKYVPDLKPNETSVSTITFDLTGEDIADGEYWLGAITDFTKRIDEEDETNNHCLVEYPRVIIDSSEDSVPEVPEPEDEETPNEPIAEGGCSEYDFNDFESSLYGIWQDGGAHAFINSGATFAYSGARALALRGNEGVASSIFSEKISMSGYSTLKLSFSFYSFLMEGGDAFVLEADRGNGFELIKEWKAISDFDIETDIQVNMDIASTSDIVLRFRSKTNYLYEYVFLDDIRIERCTNSNNISPNYTQNNSKVLEDRPSQNNISIYPNPVSKQQILNFKLDPKGLNNTTVWLYNSMGQLMLEQNINSTDSTILLEGIESGSYIVVLDNDGKKETQKLIVID